MSLWPFLLSAAPGESVAVAGLPDGARPAFDHVKLGAPPPGVSAPAYDHGLVLVSSPRAPEVRHVVASVRPGGSIVLAVAHRLGRRTLGRTAASLDRSGVHVDWSLWCSAPWSNPHWLVPTTPSVARWFAEDFTVSWNTSDVVRAVLARRSPGGLGWLADGFVLVGHVPTGTRCSRC